MPTAADLTPFGFTATESLVYGALLRLGPSTGYGVAHATRVARANTYHALEGLVGRAAAVRVAGRPARYRAADPRALLAQLAAEQGDALDRLSRALREAGERSPGTGSSPPALPAAVRLALGGLWAGPAPCLGRSAWSCCSPDAARPRFPPRAASPLGPSSPRAPCRSRARGSATSMRAAG